MAHAAGLTATRGGDSGPATLGTCDQGRTTAGTLAPVRRAGSGVGPVAGGGPNHTAVPADAWTRACDPHAGRAVRGIPVGRAEHDAWPLRRNGQLWRLRTWVHRHAHRLLTRRIRDRTSVAHISRRGGRTPHGAS